MFIIYLHTEFHLPISTGSLIIAVIMKAKTFSRLQLFVSHSTKDYFNKSCIYFSYVTIT
jgi:hypothetical protein